MRECRSASSDSPDPLSLSQLLRVIGAFSGTGNVVGSLLGRAAAQLASEKAALTTVRPLPEVLDKLELKARDRSVAYDTVAYWVRRDGSFFPVRASNTLMRARRANSNHRTTF